MGHPRLATSPEAPAQLTVHRSRCAAFTTTLFVSLHHHAPVGSARQCRRRKRVECRGVETGAGQGADRGHRSGEKSAVVAIDAVPGILRT